MRLLVPFVVLLSSCDSHFNMSGLLVKEPKPAAVVGAYTLDPKSGSHEALAEMGYSALAPIVTLAPDLTFTASGIPGCCVHGFDERAYAFSGGTYEFSGTWKIEKQQETYGISLELSKISGKPAKELPATDPAGDRKPPQSLSLSILEEPPMALGFPIFDGDFSYISLGRKSP